MNAASTGEAEPRENLELIVPPFPLQVRAEVFDGFGWCSSTTLRLSLPARRHELQWKALDRINFDNPAGMYFVRTHGARCELPEEDASGHSAHWALAGRRILAPWAIDDATDALYAQRIVPRLELELWANDVAGVYWGLHDWVHFHNHGAFDDRPATELQCDLTALDWIHRNRQLLSLDAQCISTLVLRIRDLNAHRFSTAGRMSEYATLEPAFLLAQRHTDPGLPGLHD
jgi:hypothetical protein